MRSLFLLFLTVPIFAGEPNALTAEEKAEGWKLLFNGKDLEGWRIYGSDNKPLAGWRVVDGLLVKEDKVPGGNIITEEKFDDFELSWEWKIVPKGNNGIKYLVTEERKGAPGPEYQMLDDDGHPDAKNGPKRQNAALYDIKPASEDKPSRAVGEWNHSRIIVKGNEVEHWLNGAKVVEFTLGSPELLEAVSRSKFKSAKGFGEKNVGHIMLTDHADGCSFRNVKIRVF